MKRSSFITWEQLRVGVVILGALVVVAFAIYKLGQTAHLFHRRYELDLVVGDASGLMEGGPVLIAGQTAGTISAIEFLPVGTDTLRHLRIRMAIDQGLEAQVRGDSKAKVRTQGLLGDKVIDISPGSPRFAVLRAHDTLAVVQSIDYDVILAQAAGAVTEMVDLTREIRQVTDGLVHGRGTIGQLLTNRAMYDEFVATLTRANDMLARFQNPHGTMAQLLDDPTLYNRLVTVVTSADSLVGAMNDRKGTVGKLLHDDTLYTKLVGMAAAGDSLMRSLSSGQGLAGRLLNDPTLYDRLNKLLTDIDATLGDVQKDPQRYLRGVVCVFKCSK